MTLGKSLSIRFSISQFTLGINAELYGVEYIQMIDKKNIECVCENNTNIILLPSGPKEAHWFPGSFPCCSNLISCHLKMTVSPLFSEGYHSKNDRT